MRSEPQLPHRLPRRLRTLQRTTREPPMPLLRQLLLQSWLLQSWLLQLRTQRWLTRSKPHRLPRLLQTLPLQTSERLTQLLPRLLLPQRELQQRKAP